MTLVVRSAEELREHLQKLECAAAHAQRWLKKQTCSPLESMMQMKFEKVGMHPVGGHALNLIEQINQTCTYAVAFAAVRLLIEWHPEANGFRIAPGAQMSIPLDVMSVEEGMVGAETFAAVHPRNNRKLAKDLEKLSVRSERHRYLFLASPLHHGLQRLPHYERPGIQVWSVSVS